MGHRGRLIGLIAGLRLIAQSCAAQSGPTSGPAAFEVATALQDVHDFSFDLGQPGLYALLEYLKSPAAPSPAQMDSEAIDDWSVLVERPRDFRGRVVTINGVVGRNSAWRMLDDAHAGLGHVWQLEVRGERQAYPCTVLLSGDATDIPIGATIRVNGYFCFVRQYRGESGQVWQAPVVVGVGPSEVARGSAQRPLRTSDAAYAAGWLISIGVGLAAIFLGLRWFLRGGAGASRGAIEAKVKAAPFSVAEDLTQWAQSEPEQQTHDH